MASRWSRTGNSWTACCLGVRREHQAPTAAAVYSASGTDEHLLADAGAEHGVAKALVRREQVLPAQVRHEWPCVRVLAWLLRGVDRFRPVRALVAMGVSNYGASVAARERSVVPRLQDRSTEKRTRIRRMEATRRGRFGAACGVRNPLVAHCARSARHGCTRNWT